MSSVTFRGLAGETAFRVPFVALSASELSVTVAGTPAAFSFANGVLTLGSALSVPADVVVTDIGLEERKFGNGDIGGPQQVILDAAIASGGTDSNLVDLGNFRPVAIVLPSAFTGTVITPKTSFDGSTINPVYDAAGTQKTLAVAANRRVLLTPADYVGVRYLQLISGSAEAAARTVKIIAEI